VKGKRYMHKLIQTYKEHGAYSTLRLISTADTGFITHHARKKIVSGSSQSPVNLNPSYFVLFHRYSVAPSLGFVFDYRPPRPFFSSMWRYRSCSILYLRTIATQRTRMKSMPTMPNAAVKI
jgi:hypothetical protein